MGELEDALGTSQAASCRGVVGAPTVLAGNELLPWLFL